MALKDLVVVVVEEAAKWRNGGCFRGWKRMLCLSLCIIHGSPSSSRFFLDDFLVNIYGR